MPKWFWTNEKNRLNRNTQLSVGQTNLESAQHSLQELVGQRRLSPQVRQALDSDFQELQTLLDKLAHGHIHVAVFGRVSVGKSSLLNALINEERFKVSPLHGETKSVEMASWAEGNTSGVFLLDTPGIDEINGEAREQIAKQTVNRADLVIFVLDGDLTRIERVAIKELTQFQRPIVIALNKADRYSDSDLQLLINNIAQGCEGMVGKRDIVPVQASPMSKEDSDSEPLPDVRLLKDRLWQILESEGKTLAALNAGLFADNLSEQINKTILRTRSDLAYRVIRSYCVGKGVAVALNPVPVADLLAAAAVDATMVVHLSKVYGLPLTKNEASRLIATIISQLAALMGSVWAVHLLSSALKLGTAGLSTVLTAGVQGAVAYYSTHIIGSVAQAYLAQGKSWGDGGPKRVVQDIVDSLDRDSILAQAREDIRLRLRKK